MDRQEEIAFTLGLNRFPITAIAQGIRRASQDVKDILKALPSGLKETGKTASIRIDDRPTPEMIEAGVPPDAMSMTERESGVIVIFVMNLFD